MAGRREALLDYLTCRTEDPAFRDTVFTGPNPNAVKLDPLICERPMQFTGYDAFGVHWTEAQPASHRTPGQKPVLEDIGDWASLPVPDVDRFPWDSLQAPAQEGRRQDLLVSVTLLTGPFERATVLMDFEDCLVAALTEPEEFSGLMGRLCDYKIAQIRRICRAAHPDVVNLHDDWGTARSTFLAPELWREIVRPHIQRVYDAIHEEGALVCQHSCGNIAALLPDLMEMGAEMWEAQLDCFDLAALKDQCRGKLRVLSRHWEAAERGEAPPAPPAPPKADLDSVPPSARPYDRPPVWD